MILLRHKNTFDGFFRIQLRYIALCFIGLMLAGFTSLSYSAYQYTYTGKTITGSITYYHPEYPEPYNIETKSFTGAILFSLFHQFY